MTTRGPRRQAALLAARVRMAPPARGAGQVWAAKAQKAVKKARNG